MTTAAANPPSALHLARQVVGMAILALANPFAWHGSDSVKVWLSTLVMPLLAALVLFGIYALVFRKRARDAWPKSFFMLAWVLLALLLAGAWSGAVQQKAEPISAHAPTTQTSPHQVRHPQEANPFSDPNYGKDLVR